MSAGERHAAPAALPAAAAARPRQDRALRRHRVHRRARQHEEAPGRRRCFQ
uniref:Uncharacterized protein n=1 Tax=Arundo donax TaxID=35708 RepID=A0A0A9B416_ARUDO